jgi:hypothetical protein
MGAIAITVRLPNAAAKTYRFDETPLLIGRSPECALAICHEAVPRALCRIWSEERGRAVRVEALPGLTNPLTCNGRRLFDGATGPRLLLAVGPIELDVRPAAASTERAITRRPTRVLAVAAVALVGLLAIGLSTVRNAAPAPPPGGIALLPDDLPPAPPTDHCEAHRDCAARAELLATRGRALLANPAAAVADLYRASRLLDRGARLATESGAPSSARLRKDADHALSLVTAAYRRERARLQRALELDDPIAAARSAARLRDLLPGNDTVAARRWLGGIAADHVEVRQP